MYRWDSVALQTHALPLASGPHLRMPRGLLYLLSDLEVVDGQAIRTFGRGY